LPQFGTFLEIAKILTKFLPQFGVSDSDLGNLRGSCPTVNAIKILRVLFFQSRFKTTKSTLLLLFSKVSKLGFDNLGLCRVDVLSEKASISNIKLLTMSFKQKLPQFSKMQRCWVKNLFSKVGL
jgi:hypothetical protein